MPKRGFLHMSLAFRIALNFSRCALFCASAALFCRAADARAAAESTLKLTTGEIVKGAVLSKTASGILIKTAYAEFVVPYQLIDSESVKIPPAPKKISDISEREEMSMPMQEGEIISQNANVDALVEYPPLFDDSGSSNRVPEFLRTLRTWQDDYIDFITPYIPEGWYIKLSGGYLIKQTSTSERTLDLAFSAEREWDVYSLSLSGYYNYTLYTDTGGASSATTDKYGLAYSYKWKFLGAESDWYMNSNLSYKVDAIKLINTQLDQVVGVGYAYSIKEWGISTSIDTGPSVRYLDLENEKDRVIPSWSLNESIYWDITDLLRFEHTASLSASLGSEDDASAYIMVGLVFAPKSVVSIALRYTGDYDNLTDIKYEERFIISFEIPFDGRKK